MKQTSSNQSGIFTLRLVLASALVSLSVLLAFVSFAAAPASATISPGTTTPITWQGTAPGQPPSAGGEGSCVEGVNCDTFRLTVSGTPTDWAGKGAKVRIQWLTPASDYDLYVHKGAANGPIVANSGSSTSVFEEVLLNPSSPSIGTGDFFVHVVYFAITSGDQYNGDARVVSVANPPPAVQASGVAPRYQNYTPPAAGPATLGIDAGEPSLGVNWKSENVPASAGRANNGGRSMYVALLQTLRITFDDSCPSSPSALWEDKSFAGTSAQTFDPILYTDHTTGRTLVSQLIFPAGAAASASAYTENDGDTYVTSTGAGPGSGIDHQSIGGGGPFHAPVPVGAAYPNPIYYCAQLPTKTCALSIDGGTTYGPAVPIDSGSQCGGLHGHIKVGPDGTAYLPVKGCGISQGVIVTENNGATWSLRTVPNSIAGSSDSAVGIGSGDKTAGAGRVYFGYASGDTGAAISVSNNRGVTWSPAVDVGAKFGINNVVFPAVVAGDDDRAAFAFYGTPTAGSLQDPKFAGVWHLYVAHTYDGGLTWSTVDATPNDPMQRGCIWLGGGSNICRNMLDFMGVDVDKRGRVVVGYNDGCAGAECSQARPNAVGNSYTSLAAIARQTGGKGLFAAQDALFPDAATAPGAPYLTALRNGGTTQLQWSVSNDGGSPVTGFTIERATAAAGPFAAIANVSGNLLRYEDPTADPAVATYFYRVSAANAAGASCGSNQVPAPFVGSSSSTDGYRVALDPANDHKNAPADPDLDVRSLSISEPSTGPNAGKMVFKLKLGAIPSGNEKKWRIIWNSPNAVDNTQKPAVNVGQFYVGFFTDSAGALKYDYGTVQTGVVGLVLGVPETRPAGTPDAGSTTPEGLVTIVVSRDKIGNVARGDLMGRFSVRTYRTPEGNFVRSTDAIDTTTNATASDQQANAFTYMVQGPLRAQLQNIATRAQVGTGDRVLIGGFIVTGTDPKRVLVRGRGPSLNGLPGISDPIHDPFLELYNSTPTNGPIATNDNWQTTQSTEIIGSGLAPSSPLDAVIVQTLAPGNYTAVVRDKDTSAPRLGIVEVFDVAPASNSQLANLSSRGFVGTGDNVLIGGVIVGPASIGNANVVVRALGPSLTAFGVSGVLPDPTVKLIDQNGTPIASNDDWRSNEGAITAQAPTLAPTRNEESALIISLAPGQYTAIVEGKNATGVATVDVFNLSSP